MLSAGVVTLYLSPSFARSRSSRSWSGDGRKRGRELLVQLDGFSLAVGLARGVQGRIVEFARDLQSLEVNAGDILRFELLAEEPVTDLRGAIEDLAEEP